MRILKPSLNTICYVLGIIIFAFLINLGSALPEPMYRLKKPVMVLTILFTIPLTFLYLYYISWVQYRLFTFSKGTKKRPLWSTLPLFLFMTAGLVWGFHMLLLYTVVVGRSTASLFSKAYFAADFWFFIIPLLLYCLYLFFEPERTLFSFGKLEQLQKENHSLQSVNHNLIDLKEQLITENTDLLVRKQAVKSQYYKLIANIHEHDQAAQQLRIENKELSFEVEQLREKTEKLEDQVTEMPLHSGRDELPLLWLEERSVDVLLQYICERNFWKNPLPDHTRFVLELIIIERVETVYFGIYANGKKWLLPNEAVEALLNNPWIVKLNNKAFVNMLYCKKNMLPVIKGSKIKRVELISFFRTQLDENLDTKHIDELLETERLRPNFEKFWEYDRLLKMDASRLYDTFRSD